MDWTKESQLLQINAERICIVKPSALGDVVQTMPLLGALRRRFPSAHISWVINHELGDLLAGHADLDEVISFERRGSLATTAQLLWELHRRRFDLVFDLQGLLRTALMTWATGAPLRFGLESAREGSNLACNGIVRGTGRDVAAHARYWRVAEALGVGDVPRSARVSITATEDSWLRDRLWSIPRPILAIHPGAKWITKRWPAEKFAEVATRFAGRYSGTVVAVGSGGDWPAASTIVDRVKLGGRPALNLAGTTTLKQLAALLGAADLVLSNDSGPMHLAAAMGTPVVGLFTCTSPAISGPSGVGHRLIATSVPCAAGYHKTCPHRGSRQLACLRELDVERAWNAVAASLDSARPGLRIA